MPDQTICNKLGNLSAALKLAFPNDPSRVLDQEYCLVGP